MEVGDLSGGEIYCGQPIGSLFHYDERSQPCGQEGAESLPKRVPRLGVHVPSAAPSGQPHRQRATGQPLLAFVRHPDIMELNRTELL